MSDRDRALVRLAHHSHYKSDHVPDRCPKIVGWVDYEPTLRSIRFTLRGLEYRGMIVRAPKEIRRERKRLVIAPTLRGVNLVRDDSSGGGDHGGAQGVIRP